MSDETGSASEKPARTRRAKPPPRVPYPPPDALVAIIKNQRDLERARDEGWYRVPVATAPAALADGSVRTLAFYLPKSLGADAFQVVYTAPVLGLTTLPRRALLPDEPRHVRADDPYLRVALGPLRRLPRPIPSQRLRRVPFIATTTAKLDRAQEINDLYHDSPLEDAVYAAFQAAHIVAERQYFVPGDERGRYALDFAIFGQRRNLDVECDGDRWHANPTRAQGDNRRNNYLTARGWSVLRFSTAEIEDDLPHVVRMVRETMRDCGGMASQAADVPATPAGDPDAPTGATTAPDAPAAPVGDHSAPVGDHSAPVGDHSAPVGDHSAPPPALLWQPALWDPEIALGQTVDPRVPARKRRRRT
jgi:very-short-patch-repair endonuclease